ncbi:MAG TPA: hypothetical protein VG276_20325 [Actinomycetes bacterium]|nr:hypothetical protein [Actinomycetes bacterium]
MSRDDHEHFDYVDQRYFDDLEAEVRQLRRDLLAETARVDELCRQVAELDRSVRALADYQI